MQESTDLYEVSMRIFSPLRFLATLIILFVSCSSWAHHGWGVYNADIDTTLTITELQLGGSHDHLSATDAEGEVWDLVLATPQRNRRLGFNEDTLSVGDQIDLIGRLHPSRNEIKVHCIYMSGEVKYTYYDFDGTTSLSKHSNREQC